ncbi:NUDIX domain-containing protein [Frankia gtarii]|uniref:NUDIX domain-containing protein n=1 Tax=Frankia gtarii TaxID=2950102 RepID=UPI0021BEFD0B|nr:NUDIX domain-containing protein [Frankia gtarii]
MPPGSACPPGPCAATGPPRWANCAGWENGRGPFPPVGRGRRARPPEVTAREAGEETGLTVEIIGILETYTDPRHVIAYDDGEIRQQFAICFEARITGGTLLADGGEVKEARFVAAEDLDTLNLHPSRRPRVGHYLARRLTPYIGQERAGRKNIQEVACM